MNLLIKLPSETVKDDFFLEYLDIDLSEIDSIDSMNKAFIDPKTQFNIIKLLTLLKNKDENILNAMNLFFLEYKIFIDYFEKSSLFPYKEPLFEKFSLVNSKNELIDLVTLDNSAAISLLKMHASIYYSKLNIGFLDKQYDKLNEEFNPVFEFDKKVDQIKKEVEKNNSIETRIAKIYNDNRYALKGMNTKVEFLENELNKYKNKGAEYRNLVRSILNEYIISILSLKSLGYNVTDEDQMYLEIFTSPSDDDNSLVNLFEKDKNLQKKAINSYIRLALEPNMNALENRANVINYNKEYIKNMKKFNNEVDNNG